MTLRPKLTIENELLFYQIGEPWLLSVSFIEADTPDPWYPTTATITITHSGNGALSTPISAVSMTVADNVATYTMAAGIVTSPEKNLKATIEATDGTNTWTDLVLFDAVRFCPRVPATMDEVATRIPKSSRLALDGNPTLRESWHEVLEDIASKGIYPQFAIDTGQLKLGHLYKTRANLYADNVREQGDAFDVQAQRWATEYDEWLSGVKLDLDLDESGTIEESERMRSMTSVHFGRANA